MGTMNLVWQTGHRFAGTDSRGHRFDIGEDPSGRAAKASDLLPLSLAGCTAYTVVDLLEKMRQPMTGLRAEIEYVQDPDPPWTFRRIRVAFVVDGEVDEGRARRALELAHTKYCSVSATLHGVVDLEFDISVKRP